MKRFVFSTSMLLYLFGFLVAFPAIGQIPPPPPAKVPPVEKTELSEKEFEERIKATLKKPEQWKEQAFVGFAVKAILPRDPVRQTESTYEPALGNVKVTMFVGAGDSGTYVIGKVPMPYSITDEATLRTSYDETANEFAADPEIPFRYVKDFRLDGKLGIEAATSVKDGRFIPARMRVIFLERNMYLLLATPNITEGEDEPPSKEERSRIERQIDLFFASLTYNKEMAAKPSLAQPMFEGQYTDGIYRSKFFDFSMSIPVSWIQVDHDDVEGVRKWGRDYIAANSDLKVPQVSKGRKNLATFVSAPLGSEKIAMLSINVGTSSASSDDPMKFAKLTEEFVSKIAAYEVIKSPFITTIGAIQMVRLETRVRVEDHIQEQVILVCRAKGSLLAFTLVSIEPADKEKMLSAMETLRFSSK